MIFGVMSFLALVLAIWSILVLFGWLPKNHAYDFCWRFGMIAVLALFVIGCIQEVV